MANKQFGVKEFTLIGSSGSPSLTSPNNLNLNANTVAISTNATVGGNVTVNNNLTSNDIIVTNLNVTGVTTITTLNATTIIGSGSTSNVRTNSLNVSGVSTFAGITTVTGTTFFTKQLNVSGVSTFRNQVFVDNQLVVDQTSTNPSIGVDVGGNTAIKMYYDTSSTQSYLVSTNKNINIKVYSPQNVNIMSGDLILASFYGNSAAQLYKGVTVTGTTQTDNLNVSGITTTATLNVGTGGTVITTNSGGKVGIGTTNPTSTLTVGAVGASGTSLLVNGNARITGITTHQDAISIRPLVYGNEYVSISPYGRMVLGSSDGTTAGIDIINNTTSASSEIFTISTPDVNLYDKKIIVDYGGRLLLGGNLDSSLNNAYTVLDNSGNITLTGYVSAGGTIGASGLYVGTGGTVITTNSGGKVGIGTTNPGYADHVNADNSPANLPSASLTVGSVGTSNTSFVVNGKAFINGIHIHTGLFPSPQNNAYFGWRAGMLSASGGLNAAFGSGALTTPSGTWCSAFGNGALAIATGNENSAFGSSSGASLTNGTSNTLIGRASGVYLSSGSNNTLVGYYAGGGSLNASTSNNTYLGYNSGVSMSTGSSNTIIGTFNGNQNGLNIRTSSNNVVLSDGDGNIRFYANSSGNVGIGTTNPTSALTVTGTTQTDKLNVGTGVSISTGIVTATNGFHSGIGTAVQITTVGNRVVLTVPGVGTTSLQLF